MVFFTMDEFCRFCLTEEGVATQLFDDSHENEMYAKVKGCMSVKIKWGDGLPTSICQECADRVDALWRFKQTTMRVDSALRKLLKSLKLNASNEWKQEIRLIAQETQSVSTVKQRKGLSPSKGPSPTTKNSLCVEFEKELHDDMGGADSPATPPSPMSLNFKTANEEDPNQISSPQTRKRARRKSDLCCKFCGRKYLKSSHLAQHELTHVAGKPFQCSDCDKSFSYKASLIGHIKQTHTGNVNYTCDLCGKGFFKKTELTRHKPTHSNETPHKCPECGLGFKITKTLRRHIRNVHNSERLHICHTCGKNFSQFQTLKVHMLLHTGEKPYVCSHCGKGFAQSAPLKTHIRIHTGERPYACHVCGDTFTNRSALTSHAFKHDALPYQCTRCSAMFRLRKELVCHEQGHVDEETRSPEPSTVTVKAEVETEAEVSPNGKQSREGKPL